MPANNHVFATYVESEAELANVYRLTKSLRTFGGQFAGSPLWLYFPDNLTIKNSSLIDNLRSQGVEIKTFTIPKEARWFYYAGKVYAAGEAETAAEKCVDILVWLDEDTVILDEPSDFNLSDDIDLAYVPVMHNRSGSLLENPPDPFWSRIYDLLSINEDMLFPMLTPADKQTIRAYFHCGLIVVRPEKGVLRRWVNDFEILYNDPSLTGMCQTDATKRIFIHQTALTGGVHIVSRQRMKSLPMRYNYPIFFEKQYGGIETFDSIENVTTVRCVVSAEKMGENWHEKLSGPAPKIDWLREHF